MEYLLWDDEMARIAQLSSATCNYTDTLDDDNLLPNMNTSSTSFSFTADYELFQFQESQSFNTSIGSSDAQILQILLVSEEQCISLY